MHELVSESRTKGNKLTGYVRQHFIKPAHKRKKGFVFNVPSLNRYFKGSTLILSDIRVTV